MLNIKVLGYRRPARYAVRRIVTVAWEILRSEFPGEDIHISDISSANEISRYTPVFVMASLVINEKLVCAGRVPSQTEVREWMREALAA